MFQQHRDRKGDRASHCEHRDAPSPPRQKTQDPAAWGGGRWRACVCRGEQPRGDQRPRSVVRAAVPTEAGPWPGLAGEAGLGRGKNQICYDAADGDGTGQHRAPRGGEFTNPVQPFGLGKSRKGSGLTG